MSSDESDKNEPDEGNDDADTLEYCEGYSNGYDQGNIIITIIIIIFIMIIIMTRLFRRGILLHLCSL